MGQRRLTILYIARSTFGVMGEAAISNYARVVSSFHDVHVFETPANNEVAGPLPEGVQLHTSFDRGPQKRRHVLFDVLRKVKPDIVHLVQSPYCYDDVMMLKPVFDDAVWCFDFRSPHVGDPDAPAIARYHDMQFEVDCLLTHSKESLRTNLPKLRREAEEIPPGVDIGAIQEVTLEKPQEHLSGGLRKLVYVGSLSQTRKLDEMLRIFSQAHLEFGGLSLDIFGQGNAEVDLQRLAIELGLENAVKFCGRLDQKLLWGELPRYDAGLAYVPTEMFGTAPSLKSIEYAALGLPVLASDTEGHRAFSGRYGFDFDLFPNEPDGLTASLKVENGANWTSDRLSRNLAATREMDWARIIEDRLLPIYDRLIAQKLTR